MTDELQRLKDFRAAEPPPSEAAQRIARAALTDAISGESRRSSRRSGRRRAR